MSSADDHRAWAALWRATGDEPDPQRRFSMRVRLVDEALGEPDAAPARVAARLLTVAAALIPALEAEPREPVLLNHAGVALYELGELDAAEALFDATLRLDPQLPWIDGNREQLRRRRAAGTARPVSLRGDHARELRDLTRRAVAVADRARPVTGLTLSLCMIVKNEEAMLGRCLDAVVGGVDEVVIVDTGSADRTVEIAESFGASVLHHAWNDDFAAARNVSFDAATGDWLLYLDADEVLHPGHAERLRALTGQVWREAMSIVGTSHTGADGDGTAMMHHSLRLFRNRPDRRFHGRLHEQVAGLEDLSPHRFAVADIRFEHYGYLGEVREAKDKRHRNRAIIEQQLADGDDSPFVRFNLGMEYANDGEHSQALEQFELSWQRLQDVPNAPSLGFVPLLALHLADALRTAGRTDEARTHIDRALRIYPGFTDLVIVDALTARDTGEGDRAETLLRRCLAMGDAPTKYGATAGSGSFLPTRMLGDMLSLRGHHDEAIELLERSMRDHPRHLPTVETLALALLRSGVDPAATVERVFALLPAVSANARYLLARALQAAGASELAERELRTVLDERPESDPARVCLVEALLVQGALPAAAAEARRVIPGSRVEPAALRHAGFATLADGGDVTDVLARTADVLPAAEHDLLRAWGACAMAVSAPSGDRGAGEDAAGGRGPTTPAATIAADAAPAAIAWLNALLRLERFEAFERLATAFEAIDIPWRERREQLGGLYLRRGFLASAADEWMAVIHRDGPDARALRGLALVAAAHGMDDDAAVFAADAEALAGRPLEEIAA
ncbi:MAG: glycosyltransferase [Solirubrobacteraceae bacterium]